MGPLGYGLVGGRKWCWIAAQLSVLAALIIVYAVAHHGSVVIDFKGGFYDSGRAILTDHNPYHAGFLAHQAQVMRSGGVAIGENNGSAFSVSLYPAATILTLVPLSLLPFSVAAAIYTLLSVLALIAGLRLLGVRDNRCLMIAVGSWPFLFGVLLGAVGPWVVLGAGIAWRWRDRLWRPAVAIAGVVLLKLFPWPLAAWLLITKRWRAFLAAAAIGLIAVIAGWALLGFEGMAQYPQMLANASYIQEGRTLSLVKILTAIGMSTDAATALAILSALVVLGVSWQLARRPDGERQAFALAMLAALIGTPIVWTHDLVLLLVPIALISPRLSPIWFLPLLSPVLVGLVESFVPGANQNAAYPAAVWLAIELIVGVVVYRSNPKPNLAASAKPDSVPHLDKPCVVAGPSPRSVVTDGLGSRARVDRKDVVIGDAHVSSHDRHLLGTGLRN